MHFKFLHAFALLPLLSIPVVGQVAPAMSHRSQSPLKIGAGFSDFKTSFGKGTEKGGTLWIDYMPTNVPQFLNGIGIEIEARDLSLAPSATIPGQRIDEAQGGIIYSWQHYRSFHPYVKTLFGYGNIDYQFGHTGVRSNDSRMIKIFGGGAEYSLAMGLGARVDYEYQFWPDFWKSTNPAGSLTPTGITCGLVYRFGSTRTR